jgi:hypothetical protein
MPDPTELLAPSIRADPRSRAFAEILDRLSGLDLDPLTVYRISTTVPSVLPWLAEQLNVGGVRGWEWATTEDEQRDLVSNAVPLHRLKGTLEGYRTALRLTKTAQLETYISPPDIPYADPPLTEDEWAYFLSQMPQLRLYRYDSKGTQQSALLRRCFLVDSNDHPELKCYPMVTSARQRFGERPFLWFPDGRVEELRAWERSLDLTDKFATTIDTVVRPGQALGFFPVNYYQATGGDASAVKLVGVRSRRGYPLLVEQDPYSRIYRLELTEPFTHQEEQIGSKLISPGFEQLRVQYDTIAERSVAYGQFDGRMWAGVAGAHAPPPEPEPMPQALGFLPTWNIGGSTVTLEANP